MIGLMPRYRPRGLAPLSKRTIAYTRTRPASRRSKRRVEKQARSQRPVNTEIVLFDHGPAEFPVATARPREARAWLVALAGSFSRWLAARWQWFRPRTVPCAVAALGMIAVLASANYLAHYKEECVKQTPSVAHIEIAPR